MEYSLSRTERSNRTREQPNEPAKMSMLAMVTTTPPSLFRPDYAWDNARSAEMASARPRTGPERIALPSIRQVVSRSPYRRALRC